MSTTLTTSMLGGSHLRGTSRQTRHLPARSSRNARSTLGPNSLLSTAPTAQGAPPPDPHGFYPAITHFTDAITALPRDFRRHASLLKEVDAKAWAVEESIQKLLKDCLHERQTRPITSSAQTVVGSTSSIAGDGPAGSTAGSVAGHVLDTASQYSHPSSDPDLLRRRRLYADLRTHLMQMIMPLDEKNHVINNANDELSRHIRRQDEIWPHIADEISEESRLGSLRHWALTDLNPTKKPQPAAGRGREILMPDNEVAERSERRREAVALAKKQRSAQQADSDADLRKASRKGISNKKLQDMDDVAALNLIGNIPGVKVNKSRLAAHKKVEDPARRLGGAVGDVAMSRESSQQENSKKRKAPTPAMTAARKRLNTAAGDSPKLGHSPLASGSGKDAPKRSPALSAVRPVHARGRQNSAQSSEFSHRPTSTSRRNGVTATGSELDRVATATGKTVNEVKQAMKDTPNGRAEKMLDEGMPDSADHRIRGGIALERSASKSSQLKKDDAAGGRRTASPRLTAAATLDAKSDKNGRGKASKTATPTVGTFADADASESAAEATSTAENGSEPIVKPKRPTRPRMKDHHGLHDSLSPKGLPTKRTHKKNGSYSLSGSFSARSNRDDEGPERQTVSRTNSRSAKNADSRDARNASTTPRIGGPATEMVDEPESLPSTASEDAKPPSRRQPANARHSASLDVKPPGTSRTTAASNALRNATAASPALQSEMHDLGSPGPDIADDADADGDEDDEDPNEIRYCYCNGVSYGEMIACDNENCAREWFHLECTGLRSLPPMRSTWFCDECKATMAR